MNWRPYDSLRQRAALGRSDACVPGFQAGLVIVYTRTDTHAAAVAFWRALGLAGWRNRHFRKRGVGRQAAIAAEYRR